MATCPVEPVMHLNVTFTMDDRSRHRENHGFSTHYQFLSLACWNIKNILIISSFHLQCWNIEGVWHFLPVDERGRYRNNHGFITYYQFLSPSEEKDMWL